MSARTLESPGNGRFYWLTSRLARYFAVPNTTIDEDGIEDILNYEEPESVTPPAPAGGNLTPSAPRSPSGEAGTSSGQIDVEWIRPEFNSDGIVRYIFFLTANGTAYVSKTVLGDFTSGTLTGLTANTQYTIQMFAVNAAGNGSLSGTFTATSAS